MDGAPPVQSGPQSQPQIQWPERNNPRKYPSKSVLFISATVIVLGILCVIFGITDFFVQGRIAPGGGGIWGGALFILVGSFGVVSAKNTTTCWMVTVLTMSVIGAVISVGPLTIGSIGWAIGGGRGYYHYHGYAKSVAVNIMLVFATLAAGILLIIMSALACYGVCCRNSKQRMLVAGQIQYIPGPNGQQQMVIIPIPQGASYIPGQQVVVANPPALAQQTFPPTAPPSTSSPVAPPAYEEKQEPPVY